MAMSEKAGPSNTHAPTTLVNTRGFLHHGAPAMAGSSRRRDPRFDDGHTLSSRHRRPSISRQ